MLHNATRWLLGPFVILTMIMIAGCATSGHSTGSSSITQSGAIATNTAAPTSTTTTPSPTTNNLTGADLNGTWKGQGTYYNGRSPFDMTLIVSDDGTDFTGTLQENVYSSTVAIAGTITKSSSNIIFTDDAAISGTGIALNCTYTATVSNGHMTGFWSFHGDSSPDGTITLDRA